MRNHLLQFSTYFSKLRSFSHETKNSPSIFVKCLKEIPRKISISKDFSNLLFVCSSSPLISFHIGSRSLGFLSVFRAFHKSIIQNMAFQEARDRFLTMTLEQKRKHYKCGKNFVTINEVQPWIAHLNQLQVECTIKEPGYQGNSLLNSKVSIFVGDITALEVDVVVNAANNALLGGGGVDGAIHRGAGPHLLEECKSLNGCKTGEVKLTGGYELPAKYVIQTVGPVGENAELLEQCYFKSLELMKHQGQQTIAFPCISTGIYGYPAESAAHTAIKTVREWMEKNQGSVRKLVFCLYLHTDLDIYENLMQHFFPPA